MDLKFKPLFLLVTGTHNPHVYVHKHAGKVLTSSGTHNLIHITSFHWIQLMSSKITPERKIVQHYILYTVMKGSLGTRSASIYEGAPHCTNTGYDAQMHFSHPKNVSYFLCPTQWPKQALKMEFSICSLSVRNSHQTRLGLPLVFWGRSLPHIEIFPDVTYPSPDWLSDPKKCSHYYKSLHTLV